MCNLCDEDERKLLVDHQTDRPTEMDGQQQSNMPSDLRRGA